MYVSLLGVDQILVKIKKERKLVVASIVVVLTDIKYERNSSTTD